MNNTPKQPKNHIETSPALSRLIISWLILSFIISLLTYYLAPSLNIAPPLPHWASQQIVNQKLFSYLYSMQTLLAPLYFIAIWRFGFIKISLSRPAKLAILGGCLAWAVFLTGAIPLDGGNIFSRLFKTITAETDWLGGALLYFIAISTLTTSLVLTLKKGL